MKQTRPPSRSSRSARSSGRSSDEARDTTRGRQGGSKGDHRPGAGGGGRSGARAGRRTERVADTARRVERAPDAARRGGAERAGANVKITVDLYGHHAVSNAILNPERRISALYATADQVDLVAEWVRDARAAQGLDRPSVTPVPRAAFDAVCGAGVVHQGVGVATAPLPDVSLDDILRGLLPDQSAVLVMLDQVTDPHNFGAILRSACAFGAVGVVVQRRHAPDLSALVAKIACGAVEHIPVAFETNLSRAIDMVRDHDFRVVGLDERGERTIADLPPHPRTMIVMGAEGPGLRRLVREGCNELVRLPTAGAIASLNVSNAAAVALYAVSVGAEQI